MASQSLSQDPTGTKNTKKTLCAAPEEQKRAPGDTLLFVRTAIPCESGIKIHMFFGGGDPSGHETGVGDKPGTYDLGGG